MKKTAIITDEDEEISYSELYDMMKEFNGNFRNMEAKKMKKKIAYIVIISLLGLLCACGNVNSKTANEADKNETILDIFFSKDELGREYAKTILKNDVAKVKVGEFEFCLDELVYDMNTGIGVYGMTITSEDTDMNTFEFSGDSWPYLLTNEKYDIELMDGDYMGTIGEIENVADVQKKLISKNEMKIYKGYTNIKGHLGEGNDIDIVVLDNEEDEKSDERKKKGKIQFPDVSNSVEIKLSEDYDIWISAFGLTEYYTKNNDIIGNSRESFIAFKNGSKIVICDDNTEMGYLVSSDSIYETRQREFSKTIDINEIDYLYVDGKQYEVNSKE